jgi:glutaredoxin
MFRHFPQLILGMCAFCCVLTENRVHAEDEKVQLFLLEMFYDSTVENSNELKAAFEKYGEDHPGLKLYLRDVYENEKGQQRLQEMQDYFKIKEAKLPALYGLKYFAENIDSAKKMNAKLDEMLTLTAYVRNGCPHCKAAKAFLTKYGGRYPALNIVYREVTTDKTASQEMRDVARRYRQRAASLPLLHYCNGVSIGYSTERTTGVKILKTLDYWSEGGVVEKKK